MMVNGDVSFFQEINCEIPEDEKLVVSKLLGLVRMNGLYYRISYEQSGYRIAIGWHNNLPMDWEIAKGESGYIETMYHKSLTDGLIKAMNMVFQNLVRSGNGFRDGFIRATELNRIRSYITYIDDKNKK
jgi:hypothetical protein